MGKDDLVKEKVKDAAAKRVKSIKHLHLLEDHHLEFCLLRHCFATSINHLARSVPPQGGTTNGARQLFWGPSVRGPPVFLSKSRVSQLCHNFSCLKWKQKPAAWDFFETKISKQTQAKQTHKGKRAPANLHFVFNSIFLDCCKFRVNE